MRFGRLGREEGVLLCGLENGGLIAKVFRRTATLKEKASVIGAPTEQNQRLNVPKRTKAFVDQSLRERENSLRIHKVYQRDLFLLRFHTTKAYAGLRTGEMGSSSAESDQIDVNIDLLGFGPIFKLVMNITANR